MPQIIPLTIKEPGCDGANSFFSRLRDSIEITSRVLSIVFLFYFFDNFDLTPLFSNIISKKIILFAQFSLFTSAKIVLISGGLGNIARISAGEEDLLTVQSFFTQAERYWKLALFFAFIPPAVHFLIYLATGQYLSFGAIATFFDIPALLLFGFFLKPFDDRQRHLHREGLALRDFLFIGSVYLLTNFFAYFIRTYLQDHFIAASLSNFGIKVMELVVFVFFIKSFYPSSPVPIGKDNPQLILISPPFSGIIQALGSLMVWLHPPAFVVLKALTPKKYRIREYSRILWHEKYYQKDALVGITCLTANSAEAYKIAKEFRKRGSKVVMGGPHVSIFPEEALDFCDSVVIGPAESVWRDILLDYERGELKQIYCFSPQEKDTALVRSYLAEQSPSVIVDFLETRRGCKFKCYFCANPALQKGLDACLVQIEQMVGYLKKVSMKYREISFIDTNIYADPEYAKELMRAIIPLKLKWVASASIDIATDDVALDLLKRSGCRGLLIGFEISADSNEAGRGGKLALAKKYTELTKKLKRVGIEVKGHFIYGFENDNLVSLCRLWLFCFKLWPHVTVLSFLTPIPGSAFFEEMVRENKIRDLNWRSYNLHTLVYANPTLDNILFRKGFVLLMLLFLGTTSTIGFTLLSSCGIVFYLAWQFGI